MSKYLIYALCDPRTDETRYIGQSSSGLNRPKDHMKPSHLKSGNTHKINWINEVLRAGFVPYIKTVEELLDPEDLDKAEIFWIYQFRALGERLTNRNNGGNGNRGYKPTEETKQKLSIANTGKKLSQETRSRISLAGKGRVKTEEERRKLSVANTGKKLSQEMVAKLIAANTGKHLSFETKEKLRASQVGRKKAPEAIAKSASARKGQKLSTETRRKMSDAKKGCPFCDETGTVYHDQKEAARKLGISQPSVSRCLLGICKSVKNHTFTYLKQDSE